MSEILAALGGSAVTAIATLIILERQRQRKVVGWELVSSTPIITRPAVEQDIRIIVSNKLLGHTDTDQNEWSEILALRAYQVRIKNTGNVTVEDLPIFFELSGTDARIISLEVESGLVWGARAVAILLQSPAANIASATVPFLNPKDEIKFSFQAVNSSSRCQIKAGEPGLSFIDLRVRQRRDRIWRYGWFTLIASIPYAVSLFSGPFLGKNSDEFIWPLRIIVALSFFWNGPYPTHRDSFARGC